MSQKPKHKQTPPSSEDSEPDSDIDSSESEVEPEFLEKWKAFINRPRTPPRYRDHESELCSEDDGDETSLSALSVEEMRGCDNPNPDPFKLYKEKWLVYKNPSANSLDETKKTCNNFAKKYKRLNYIGGGSYGEVWTVQFKGTSTIMAEKVFKLVHFDKKIIAEVKVLSSMDGCKYIPFILYSGFNEIGEWCLVMERFDGGTLHDLINNDLVINKIPAEGKQTIVYQLAIALDYLHDSFLTHGDLKPDNVGLTSCGNVRLFDFGNSLEVKSPIVIPHQTYLYSAPEKFREKPAGVASDRYSFGVIMSYLFQGKLPYSVKALQKAYYSFKDDDPKFKDADVFPKGTKERKDYISELKFDYAIQKVAVDGKWDLRNIKPRKAKNLVKKCLKLNPDERPRRLSEHKFFADATEIPSFTPPRVSPPSEVPPKLFCRFTNKKEILTNLQTNALLIPTEPYFDTKMENSIATKNPAAADAQLSKKASNRRKC